MTTLLLEDKLLSMPALLEEEDPEDDPGDDPGERREALE